MKGASLILGIRTTLAGYKSLPRRKRIAIQAVTFVLVMEITMNLLYAGFPSYWTLNIVEWNMLVFSSVTSVAAVYYAVYGIWHFDSAIDQGKKEVEQRLGLSMIKSVAPVLQRAEARYKILAPKQQKQIVALINVGIDHAFAKLEEITNPVGIDPPKGLKLKKKKK